MGNGSEGILKNTGLVTNKFPYRRSSLKLIQLLWYLISQILLFFFLLKVLNRNDRIYVNTILPIGAALAARLKKLNLIYHIHEVRIAPRQLDWVCKRIAGFADKAIFVSEFVKSNCGIKVDESLVVYNGLDVTAFSTKTIQVYPDNSVFTVMMACSARDYKGVIEFLALAEKLVLHNEIAFLLVLNANERETSMYMSNKKVSGNVRVLFGISKMEELYLQSHLVLNLSRPKEWCETFGLTLLEAMSYGIPVVGPPVGGPCEIVRNDIDGFLIDSRDLVRLKEVILDFLGSKEKWQIMSKNALVRSKSFSHPKFISGINKFINE